MFCRAVWAILLALMHSSTNKESNTSDFGVILGEIVFRHPDGKQSANSLILLVVKVWLLPIMSELVRFCRARYFVLQRWKCKKYFHIFVGSYRAITGNQTTQCYQKWLETGVCLLMKVEDRYRYDCNGFGKVVTLYHAIWRYFGKVLLQGVNRIWRRSGLFYLAPSLTLRGGLLVNPWRSIFHIADPTVGQPFSHFHP